MPSVPFCPLLTGAPGSSGSLHPSSRPHGSSAHLPPNTEPHVFPTQCLSSPSALYLEPRGHFANNSAFSLQTQAGLPRHASVSLSSAHSPPTPVSSLPSSHSSPFPGSWPQIPSQASLNPRCVPTRERPGFKSHLLLFPATGLRKSLHLSGLPYNKVFLLHQIAERLS